MRFGSEAWLENQLEKILKSTQERAWIAYKEELSSGSPQPDFDSYAYVYIPKRFKKLWGILESIGWRCDWISVSRDLGTIDIRPLKKVNGFIEKAAQGKAYRIIAEVLQAEGIEAKFEMHYR